MTLAERLRGSPFQGYAYAYPHKTAYRTLQPKIALREAWTQECKDALFLYVHIPFCEMRCSFCNLFTQAHSRSGLRADVERGYLKQLETEARATLAALGTHSFSRIAIGGGTPTFLSPDALEILFNIVRAMLGNAPISIPAAIEVSPFTATPERLAILRGNGITRVSIGIQSFVEAEVQAAGRAQPAAEVNAALSNIRSAKFQNLNIDLIYGLPGQTLSSWLYSVRAALEWSPEELYLYPLYVRPLTGLERRNSDLPVLHYEQTVPPQTDKDEFRMNCYRAARDLLLEAGLTMQSMRHFQSPRAAQNDGPVYCCQDDGMLGLGCGARSYTQALHYSNEYAVSGKGVAGILDGYLARTPYEFDYVSHGIFLNADEQRRRYLIKSLLRSDGLDLAADKSRFGANAIDGSPELNELIELELARNEGGRLRPTMRGLEYSDVIGPWLASPAVRESMEAFALR